MTQERAWQRVGWTMMAGAIYDFVFAVAILFFTAPSAALLRLDLPEDTTYLRFNGVFLLMLTGMYLFAAHAPRRYKGVVAVAIVGRLIGFIYLGSVWFEGRVTTFLLLAFADLAFSLVHATALSAARRASA